MSDVNVVLAGAAGQGVQSAAAILGKTLLRLGYHVYVTQDYQSRVRGGHNFMRVRFFDKQLRASLRRTNYLLALNEESLHIHIPSLVEEGYALCMEEDLGDVKDSRIRALPVSMGPETTVNPKFVGVKLLSMLFTMLGYPPETLKESVNIQFGKRLRPELLQANLEAVDAVSAFVKPEDVHPLSFKPTNLEGHLFLTGNDAISLGMIAAGIGVYVGYPMTPSTTILSSMATYGKKVGIAVEQVEDEVSALNVAIGASYMGARAATGSSGAGISLMCEAIGLAGITETPVVIIDAQRAGPSTGMATRTEQSDLLFVCHASQGEFPRAVIAPDTHENAFYIAAESFNIADRWHIPVFLMDDMAFADSECTIEEFDLSKVVIDRGPIAPEPEEPEVLPRYELTDSGVSPRAFPVLSKWIVASDSHEHDPVGHLTDDIENRMQQVEKRMGKLELIAGTFPGPEIVGPACDDLFICWGSTVSPALEAAQLLQQEGKKVTVGIFRYLFPMNVEKVTETLSPYKRIYTIEGNHTGQLGKLLRMETCIATAGHIGKTDGRPFTVEEAYDRMDSIMEGKS